MALVPKISASLNQKCNKITLVEETNVYNALTNTGGWGGANVNTSAVNLAYVSFYSSNNTPPSITNKCIGTISGNVFTDVTHISGSFVIGQVLVGNGIAANTVITAFITGTGNNNGGTYTVSIPQTVTSTTIIGLPIAAVYYLKSNSIDVYSSALGNPTPLSFTALQDVSWGNSDGIYQIEYTVETSTSTYKNKAQHVLFICNLCNCKDGLIVKLIDACDSRTVAKLKEKVDQMEIFIYGIQSAFACGDFDTAEAILDAATTFCQTVSDCTSCGCNGTC